jgi:hypothetical protein
MKITLRCYEDVGAPHSPTGQAAAIVMAERTPM